MPLTLRRIVPENDYDVFDKGKIVGRIYRIHNSELWRWTARLHAWYLLPSIGWPPASWMP
jgi:hypothetical protein